MERVVGRGPERFSNTKRSYNRLLFRSGRLVGLTQMRDTTRILFRSRCTSVTGFTFHLGKSDDRVAVARRNYNGIPVTSPISSEERGVQAERKPMDDTEESFRRVEQVGATERGLETDTEPTPAGPLRGTREHSAVTWPSGCEESGYGRGPRLSSPYSARSRQNARSRVSYERLRSRSYGSPRPDCTGLTLLGSIRPVPWRALLTVSSARRPSNLYPCPTLLNTTSRIDAPGKQANV
jgi:hypothetical protein